MKSWLAIDPGANGAICHLYEDGSTAFLDFKTDCLSGYAVYIDNISTSTMIGVESVHAMRGQGVTSMFSFGQRLGELEGLLVALKRGYDKIRPQTWQKACNIPAKSGKKGTHEVMSRLYPSAILTGPKGGILDGRCDALGIAHYLRKTYQ